MGHSKPLSNPLGLPDGINKKLLKYNKLPPEGVTSLFSSGESGGFCANKKTAKAVGRKILRGGQETQNVVAPLPDLAVKLAKKLCLLVG